MPFFTDTSIYNSSQALVVCKFECLILDAETYMFTKLTEIKTGMIYSPLLQHDQNWAFDLWGNAEHPCNISVNSLIEVDIDMQF